MLYDLLEALIKFIYGLFRKKDVNNSKIQIRRQYNKKKIMSYNEQQFYNLLKEVIGEDYIIWPQINLAAIINKTGNERYQSELYRNVDFGIFSKRDYNLLLLIELNDETHNTHYSRRKRDKSVNSICQDAGISIIAFWENKPNEKEYVRNRIYQYLNYGNETKTSNNP